MMLNINYQIDNSLGLLVSDKKIFSRFLYISLCKTFNPQGGHFWPCSYNLNNLGRGPLGDDKLKISIV